MMITKTANRLAQATILDELRPRESSLEHIYEGIIQDGPELGQSVFEAQQIPDKHWSQYKWTRDGEPFDGFSDLTPENALKWTDEKNKAYNRYAAQKNRAISDSQKTVGSSMVLGGLLTPALISLVNRNPLVMATSAAGGALAGYNYGKKKQREAANAVKFDPTDAQRQIIYNRNRFDDVDLNVKAFKWKDPESKKVKFYL